jgi:hypothetical protein
VDTFTGTDERRRWVCWEHLAHYFADVFCWHGGLWEGVSFAKGRCYTYEVEFLGPQDSSSVYSPFSGCSRSSKLRLGPKGGYDLRAPWTIVTKGLNPPK